MKDKTLRRAESEKSSEANISAARRDDPPSQNLQIAREAAETLAQEIDDGSCLDEHGTAKVEHVTTLIQSAITKATEAAETRLTAQTINNIESHAAPASTKHPKLGDHDCEYDSDGAPCNICGVTASAAIRYFEQNINKQRNQWQLQDVLVEADEFRNQVAAERQRADDSIVENVRLMNELADERQLREQTERVAQVCYDLHAALGVKWGDDPYAAINSMREQLLSAQAAIEKARAHDCNCPLRETVFDSIDISLLHQHDAEVRKPLVEALEQARWRIRRLAITQEQGDTICDEIDAALVQCKEQP